MPKPLLIIRVFILLFCSSMVSHATFHDATNSYDALGRKVWAKDQENRLTQFQYDRLGRLITVTNALNDFTGYGYDQLGNMLRMTNALQNAVTQFEYDKAGRRIQRILPGGQTESSVYDAAGNLTVATDFLSRNTTNSYDALNRLTNRAYFDGTQVGYTLTVTGQRKTMSDASGTTVYEYDNRDRLRQKATPQGTLIYDYDTAGRLLNLRTLAGINLNYGRDALGRLSTATDGRYARTTTYGYDGVGSLQTLKYPNAVTNLYVYDNLNRLTTLTWKKAGTTLANYGYTLRTNGSRQTLSETIQSRSRSLSWGYDATYRLTNETITATGGGLSGTVTNKYDKVGNRLSRTTTGTLATLVPSTSATYSGNDWSNADSMDANGNTLVSAGNVDSYDPENRLINRNYGQEIIVYDGDGNRVRTTANGVTTYYLVDDRNPTGYAQVLEEWTGPTGGTATLSRTYTVGSDLISQERWTGGSSLVSYYGYDGLGSVRFLSDGAGTITDTYDYEAFGTLTYSTGTTPNRMLFAGEQYDQIAKVYYNRARVWVPDTGRFTTRDTYEGASSDPASLHKYLYCRDNPVNRNDPSGHLDMVQLQTAMTQLALLAGRVAGPAAAGLKWAQYRLNGIQSTANIVQSVAARGGDILAVEQRVMKAVDGQKVEYVGRVIMDMLVKLPGRSVNTLIESKGVRWDLWGRSGWTGYITQLENQASKFAQATQAANGTPIGERVIVFSKQIPNGLENAGQALMDLTGKYYDKVLWGEQALQQFIDGNP